MVQTFSPLGRLNKLEQTTQNIEQALKEINSKITTNSQPTNMDLLLLAKFDEIMTKLAQQDEKLDDIKNKIEEESKRREELEIRMNEHAESFEDNITELKKHLEEELKKNVRDLAASGQEKAEEVFSTELAEKINKGVDTMNNLTEYMSQMKTDLDDKVNTLQTSVNKVQKLCQWYCNWSSKHEALLDHCYVDRLHIKLALNKFLFNKSYKAMLELQHTLTNMSKYKIDRATRFPGKENENTYVNINNNFIKYYIEKICNLQPTKYTDLGAIALDINTLSKMFLQMDNFKKYEIFSVHSFETTFDLKWKD